MRRDQIDDEVYAKVMWGDAPQDIVNWLVREKRLTSAQAKVLVEDSVKERRAEIRELGIKNLLLGICCLIVAGILGFLVFASYDEPRNPARREGTEIGFVLLILGFGIHKTVVGLIRLLSGRSDGSVSDMW